MNDPNSQRDDAPFDASAARFVRFNDVEVPVEIDLEEDGQVSPVQREALRLLQSLPPDVLEKAAPAVVYNHEIYRESLGDEDVPPLARPVDVWRAVTPRYFWIPPHYGFTTPVFFLKAECDWDPEHGLEVRFRNGYADAASQSGDLHLED